MSKFVKNIKCNLILSAFLCVASATAMERSPEEKAKDHMESAYRSAAILESYKKSEGDYKNSVAWTEKSIDFCSNALAALHLNHPYAASLLYRTVYDTLDMKEQAIMALRQSIAFKKAAGISTGLLQDVSLLMDAENISTKTIEGIQRLEEIDINRAISCYEHLSCNLEEPQSNLAFEALMRLQVHPGSYFAIGQSYLKRGLSGEGLKWIEKYIGGLKKPHRAPLNRAESAVLDYLESIVYKLNLDPALQLQAAYLAHQYVINVGMPTFEAFPTHLNYYNFLKKADSQFNQIATQILHVGRILAEIAEENIKEHPKLLSQFAQMQEAEAQRSGDWRSVVDMYRRAADHGCLAGIELLATSPDLHTIIENTIGIQEATNLLVRHGQKQGLLNLYKQMENPVFLVVLSLMLEGKETEASEDIDSLLTQYQDSYAPAMDLKVHQLLKTKNLSTQEEYAMDSSIYRPQYQRTQWLLPTNGYINGGYLFDTQEEAINFRKSLVALNKALEEKKQERINEISAQKMKIIDGLAAKDQFDLAQEYKVVQEALYTKFKYSGGNQPFQAGYIMTLEKSAEKGFLPAVEELQSLYSPQGTLPSAEKAAFYGQIKNILTNEDLSLLERVAKFQEAVKK